MSGHCFDAETARRSTVVLLVGMLVGALAAFSGVGAGGVAHADSPKTSSTPLAEATYAQKVAAARVVGLGAGSELSALLPLTDKTFVVALWGKTKDGSEVKARALAAFTSPDAGASTVFLTTGIFEAQKADLAKAVENDKQRQAKRRAAEEVGVTDPRGSTGCPR